MTRAQVAPPVKDLFYVGIDGTDVVDTVAWGALWRKRFGWSNLLLELAADPADATRRLDPAHPTLPMISAKRSHLGTDYIDTCIAPEGLDGSGLDARWPGPAASDNTTQINQQLGFTQTFVLNPRVDSKARSLSDSVGDLVADVVFISSHGATNGDMFGTQGYSSRGIDYIFSLIQAKALNRRFTGPKWVLLSNCNTLFSATENDWLDLIADAGTPLRGVLGFRDACPLAHGSVDLFATLIDQLAAGKSMVAAWQKALTDHSLGPNWIVLCHEDAAGDTIQDWNAGTLPPITKLKPPSVKRFTSDTPTGSTVVPVPDPFELFWSKNGTRIDATNRLASANRLAKGDKVTITLRPAGAAANFPAGSKIALMLVYIRVTYNQRVDVRTMFAVDAAGSKGIKGPVRFGGLNNFRLDKTALDTWVIDVDGTPAEVVLSLVCANLDPSGLGHHNVPLWLRAGELLPPATQVLIFDFIRNSSVIVS